jgi:hypothetical protein
MYVRASFCVSKVGTMVSSSAVGLTLGTADGCKVCAETANGLENRTIAIRRFLQIRVNVIS